MNEFSYVSPIDVLWNCAKCMAIVKSEETPGWMQNGKAVSIFTPISRYWLPGSKPGMTTGIFCSPECAGTKVGPRDHLALDSTQKANNENPQGLSRCSICGSTEHTHLYCYGIGEQY